MLGLVDGTIVARPATVILALISADSLIAHGNLAIGRLGK